MSVGDRSNIRGMRRAAYALALLASLACVDSARGQLRVVNYNIAQLIGDQAALQNVLDALQVDDKPGFSVPVSVFVFQEVKNANLVPLLNLVNASAPDGVTYVAATYTNNNEDNFGGAQALFYRSDMLQEFTPSHLDIFTGAGRYTDRWRLQILAYPSINAWFYIYGSHLKAEDSAADEAERLTGVTNIRNNADALPAGQHIIYCGDLNFYDNAEAGYLKYLAPGNGQAMDPLGSGPWNGSANALKHSQSPRLDSAGGLVGGGLDDRFDFQLSSVPFNDGEGLSLMAGAYRVFGNDGMHFDQSINAGNNFYYPDDVAASNAIADAIYDASDHIPTIVDYQLPAVLSGSMTPNYGRVIQNASFFVPFTVGNAADVVVPDGADELDFTAVGVSGVSGSISGSVAALDDPFEGSFPLDTSTVGDRAGLVTLSSTSQAVKNPTVQLLTSGMIVRASNASFSGIDDLDALKIAAAFDPDTGVHELSAPIHNLGFNEQQALLDVDALSQVSLPFANLTELPITGIAEAPAMLAFSFDTTGLKAGTHKAHIHINVSDENIPGEAAASLQLTLMVSIGDAEPCSADITGDSAVNVDDLLVVINGWGTCSDPKNCEADVNGTGAVDVDDLLIVINGWGFCP